MRYRRAQRPFFPQIAGPIQRPDWKLTEKSGDFNLRVEKTLDFPANSTGCPQNRVDYFRRCRRCLRIRDRESESKVCGKKRPTAAKTLWARELLPELESFLRSRRHNASSPRQGYLLQGRFAALQICAGKFFCGTVFTIGEAEYRPSNLQKTLSNVSAKCK